MKISEMNSGFYVRTAGIALLYFAAAHAGLMFAVVGNTVTLVWPPSGIALVAILIYGYRISTGIAVGAFLANAWVGTPLLYAASIAIGNTLEAVIGAFLLERLASFTISLNRRRDVFAFIILAAVFSTAVGAMIGVATLTMGGMVPFEKYLSIWLKWWLGDMMGVLVVGPPLLIWFSHPFPTLSPFQKIEAASLFVAILVVGYLIFASPQWAGHGYYPTSLALFPFVIWGALRFDHWGASLATLVISILAIWGTSQGSGPFAVDSSVDSLVRWCTFVNVVAMTGLLLAASSAEQRRARAELRSSHEKLEHRIRERTAELIEINANLQHAMLERNRLECRLIRVSEEHQKTIGRELHDNLGQLLTSIAFFGATLQEQLHERKRPGADAARKIVALVNQAIDLTRSIAKGLYPVALESGSLQSALEQLVNTTRELKKFACVLRADPDVHIDDPLVAINLYRFAQETINNAIKHSQARHLWVDLACINGNYRLSVSDDGIGFDPERIEQGMGLGMHNLRHRASLLGGTFLIKTNPLGGTTVSAMYPASKKDLE